MVEKLRQIQRNKHWKLICQLTYAGMATGIFVNRRYKKCKKFEYLELKQDQERVSRAEITSLHVCVFVCDR